MSNLRNHIRVNCQFCDKNISFPNITKHENACYLNPKNIRKCPVCDKIIKNKDSNTCSYSCSNTFYRSGRNASNWNEETYRTTCFEYHEKKCVICSEELIVAVHHLDGNRENNKPENLIPLCATHHQYWHSRYRYLIEDKVTQYIFKWKKKNQVNLQLTK